MTLVLEKWETLPSPLRQAVLQAPLYTHQCPVIHHRYLIKKILSVIFNSIKLFCLNTKYKGQIWIRNLLVLEHSMRVQNLQAVQHNLRSYRWPQHILESYRWARIYKILRQKCRIYPFLRQKSCNCPIWQCLVCAFTVKGWVLTPKKRVNRDKTDFATKLRMFGPLIIDEGPSLSRTAGPAVPHFMLLWLHSLGTRSAVDLLKVFSTSTHICVCSSVRQVPELDTRNAQLV